ncbi:MAG: 3'(2'),5'-bisphosphate nucleotidase CysQ [Alphaproteobacteria bacterium]
MSRDLDTLIPDLTALAQEAGRAILAVYAGDFEHRQKADGSPVTIADAQAEAIILRGLAALTPEIPAIAEESVAEAPALTNDTFWLVDPLDGTRSFIAREDEFSVNIGLIHAGTPVLGVIHGPIDGVTYTATGSGTARQIHADGNSHSISGREPPADGQDAAVSRFYSSSDKMTELLARCPLRNLVRCSSALKFGILAAGGADFYPRLGPTSEWDTAAGHAILRAIGGDVVTLDGATLTYSKPGFRNPGFIAYARHHPCPPPSPQG